MATSSAAAAAKTRAIGKFTLFLACTDRARRGYIPELALRDSGINASRTQSQEETTPRLFEEDARASTALLALRTGV
jgi:hypothetical protein